MNIFNKLQNCSLSKINNYKIITNIAIVIILINTTTSIFSQFKTLNVQLSNSELSLLSLNNIKNLNSIIDSMQKERGLSTIYVEQKNEENYNNVIAQRQFTSNYIDKANLYIRNNLSIKNTRDNIVKKIDSKKCNQNNIFNMYTDLIQDLHHLEYEQIINVKTDYIKNKLFFYTDINIVQEIFGQLRAKIGSAIASGDLSELKLLEIRYLNTLLNANIKKLSLNNEYKNKNQQLKNIINNKFVTQTLNIVDTIVSTSSLSKVNLTTTEWFILSTTSIDKLVDFTAKNLESIHKDIIKLQESSNSDFMFYTILWLVGFISIVILFFISYLKNSELKKQNQLLVDYKKAVDYRTIISKTDLKGYITYANEEFCKVSGYSREELLNKNHNIIRHQDMPSSAFRKMWKLLKQGKTWEGKVKNKKKDGSYYWVKASISPVFDENGKIKEYFGMRHDITDVVLLNEKLQKTQKELKEQTLRDPLTNLYNRRYIQDIAQDIINISIRNKVSLSLIILDIDKFKLINDTYGHSIGDDVIKHLAQSLKRHTRESDVIARIGGEEFIVLLPNTDKNGAFTIAESLRKHVENDSVIVNKDTNINFTISLGVESIDIINDKNIQEPLKRADKALYRAKESGRNRTILA